MTITVTLASATDAQLLQIANETLGLGIPRNAKGDTIRARILQATDKTEFLVTVGEAAKPAPTAADAVAPTAELPPGYTAHVPEPKYTISISKEEGPEGESPVPVSVNGRNMWIPRGAPAQIKARYYHALMNAEKSVYDQPEGPKGPMVERKVLSYPVQTIIAPTQAELDAWHQYKADVQKMEVAAAKAAKKAA